LTCSSQYREEIETAFVRGLTPTTIVRSLPSDAHLSARNLREHFLRQHLPLDNAVVARLVEEERRRQGDVVRTGAESVTRALGLSHLVRDEVQRKLEAGELAATVKDGLAAEALIAKFEMATRTSIDEDRMVAGVAAFAVAVKSTCTPEQARAIYDAIQANEDARLVAEWAGQGDELDQ